MRNVFLKPYIASAYDDYYQSDFGKKVDDIEKKIIFELLQSLSNKEILELGCGTGHWTKQFIARGFKVSAIDSSEAMLNIAKTKQIDAHFKIANAENLPFESESFQNVISITMLEFVDNQQNVINEIYRVLKPGGYFVIGGLNDNSLLGKNKQNDEVFKMAKFLTAYQLKNEFKPFKIVKMCSGVHLSDEYVFLDGTEKENLVEPIFLAALFQKI